MILSGEICIGKLLAVVAGIYLLVEVLELLTIQHSRQGVAFYCIRLQCNVRNIRIKCEQMGKHDVIKHCQSQSHKDQAKSL